MDPDPPIVVIDLQIIFNTIFFWLLLFEGTFTSFNFCMMIEGSGSGSIPLTSGSGSGLEAQKHVDPVDPDPPARHWFL